MAQEPHERFTTGKESQVADPYKTEPSIEEVGLAEQTAADIHGYDVSQRPHIGTRQMDPGLYPEARSGSFRRAPVHRTE